MRKATRAVTQLYDRILSPAGLRATQFTILAMLSLKGSLSITRMANFLVMERTTLTRNLKPLEKQGYVTILPGEDQRVRNVVLTKTGQQMFEKALPLWKQAQTKITEAMGSQKYQTFLAHLSSIISVAQKA